MRLTAQTLQVVRDPKGELPDIPAGTGVVVVGYESLPAPWGEYVVEHAGRIYRAGIEAIEIVLPGGASSVEVADGMWRELGDADTVVAHRHAPFGAIVELGERLAVEEPDSSGPPTVGEVLELLRELERQHRGGGLSLEEYKARKAELLERIRRHMESPE